MKDVYEVMTNRILENVDSAGKWKPVWRSSGLAMPLNPVTKTRYRGVNIFSTWITCLVKDYEDNRWASFKQWQGKGCKVKRGEQGTPIIFFKTYDKTADNGDVTEHIVARVSYAFNLSQVEGEYADELRAEKEQPQILTSEDQRIARIEAFIADVGAKVEQGIQPCYVPSADFIRMPKLTDFISAEHYYSTLFHEHIHWTGAKHRLDRNLQPRFNKHAYAVEELVAEMGAAFLSADFGIENAIKQDNESYLKGWLDLMKEDKRALVSAASAASKACDYIHETAAANFNATLYGVAA